ncbi:hypothetical protein STENM223S_08415 [Streptomyces tendae]
MTAAGRVVSAVAIAGWYEISTSGDLPPEERGGDQPFTRRPRASYSLRVTRPLASVIVSARLRPGSKVVVTAWPLELITLVAVTGPPASAGVYCVSVVPTPGLVTVRTRPSGSYVVLVTTE